MSADGRLVVMGGADRVYGRFSGKSAVSGPWRIGGRRDPLVVFVGGGGFVEGAITDAIGDLVEQADGLASGLLLTAAVAAGDVQEELVGLRVLGDELEEAVVLAGGAAVLVGVEVAGWGAGAGAGASSGQGERPFWPQMGAD